MKLITKIRRAFKILAPAGVIFGTLAASNCILERDIRITAQQSLQKRINAEKKAFYDSEIARMQIEHEELKEREKEIEARKKECSQEIKSKHSKEQIEAIINSIQTSTPKKAFERTRKDIKFKFMETKEIVKVYPGKICGRWYSKQESLALGEATCIDGTIDWLANLLDNPEYKARAVIVIKKGRVLQIGKDYWGSRHAMGVFEENGNIGGVSFNDNKSKDNCVFIKPTYDSINDLIINEFPHQNYTDYREIEFTPEQLKFGNDLRQSAIYKQTRTKWQQVRSK